MLHVFSKITRTRYIVVLNMNNIIQHNTTINRIQFLQFNKNISTFASNKIFPMFSLIYMWMVAIRQDLRATCETLSWSLIWNLFFIINHTYVIYRHDQTSISKIISICFVLCSGYVIQIHASTTWHFFMFYQIRIILSCNKLLC